MFMLIQFTAPSVCYILVGEKRYKLCEVKSGEFDTDLDFEELCNHIGPVINCKGSGKACIFVQYSIYKSLLLQYINTVKTERITMQFVILNETDAYTLTQCTTAKENLVHLLSLDLKQEITVDFTFDSIHLF